MQLRKNPVNLLTLFVVKTGRPSDDKAIMGVLFPKMKTRALRIFALLIFFSGALPSVHAYPIFFRCDASRQMSEFVAGQDVIDGVKKLLAQTNGDKKKLLAQLCEGKTECEKNLEQVITLAKISKEASEQKEKEILDRLKKEMDQSSPIQKTTDEALQLEKTIRETAAQVSACRQDSISIEPEKWGTSKCVTFYYPFKNEYQYASGFRYSQNQLTQSAPCVSQNDLDTWVKRALIMGIDPMVYMSIGLMEEGFGGTRNLYLDPIGIMKAMGCPENKTNVTQAGQNKLSSFGNFHSIQPTLINDTQFNERLKQSLTEVDGATLATGSSYYCSQVSGAIRAPTVVSTADPKQCCMKLPFAADSSLAPKISDSLTLNYIAKMQNQHPYGQKDPAFQMQLFNGFSTLMGGAEAVSLFRTGIDSTKTPNYGYQSMDYVLNNLASNPVLLKTIEDQKKSLKLKNLPPSILCEDPASKGPNVVDSRAYFDLHRKSGRMTSIANKPWSQMSTRQKNVFTQEIMGVQNAGMLPETINGKPVPQLGGDDRIFKYQYSDGTQTSIKSKDLYSVHSLNAGSLSQGFKYSDSSGSFECTPLKNGTIPIPSGFSITPNYQVSPLSLVWGFPPPYKIDCPGAGTMELNRDYTRVCLDNTGKSINCDALTQMITGRSYTLQNDSGDGFSVHTTKLPNPTADGPQKLVYNGGKSWVEWKKETAKPDTSTASMDQIADYYFKNIYSKRNTIEKASKWGPWQTMDDENISTMADLIDRRNNNRAPAGITAQGGLGGY